MNDPTPTLAEVLAMKDAAHARWLAADAAFNESNQEADELRARVQALSHVCGGHQRRHVTREDGVTVEVVPSDEERARAVEELSSVLDRARAAHARAIVAKREREEAGKASTEASHRWQAAIHVPFFDGR